MKKSHQQKPWLNSNGLPLTTDQLKVISQNWNQKTWANYLVSLETPLREQQIHQTTYHNLVDQMEETIFYDRSINNNEQLKITINRLLDQLTAKQRLVLKMVYWQQMSEQEIALKLNLSKSAIHETKKRALKRIFNFMKATPVRNYISEGLNLKALDGGMNEAEFFK